MGCNYCLFGKNGDSGCGCQYWVNVNEKDSQDNTDIHYKNHEWRNEAIPGLRLLDKWLFLWLRGVLRCAIYNRLRLILAHNIQVDRFNRFSLWHGCSSSGLAVGFENQ